MLTRKSQVIEYLTYQLINGYTTDEVTQYILDSYDFYIIPFVNPDGKSPFTGYCFPTSDTISHSGFVYTQTNERLWRKNRMPPPPLPANQSCFGTDVNRNWPFVWDANPKGASPDPCEQVYRGEAPGNTPENLGIRTLVDELRDLNGIKLYVDW